MTMSIDEVTQDLDSAEVSRKEMEHHKYAIWAVVVIEVLFTFFTISHNATAMGINMAWVGDGSKIIPNLIAMMGLLVYDGALLYGVWALIHGWAGNRKQFWSYITLIATALLALSLNTIVALRIEALHEFNVEISGWYANYQRFGVSTFMFILFGEVVATVGLSTFVQRSIKEAIHAFEVNDEKLDAQMAREKAQIDLLTIQIGAETSQAKDDALAEKEKLVLQRKKRQAENKLEADAVKTDLDTQLMIATLAKKAMHEFIKSAEYVDQIKSKAGAVAKKHMNKFMSGGKK